MYARDLPIDDQQVLGDACDRFEREWQANQSPDPAEFVRHLTGDLRIATLFELVLLDMAYRWRGSARQTKKSHQPQSASTLAASRASKLSPQPTLDDYQNRFPELGPVADWPAEVICEEFRLRSEIGDLVDWEDVRRRFPNRDDVHQQVRSLVTEPNQLAPTEWAHKQPKTAGRVAHPDRQATSTRQFTADISDQWFGDYEILEEIARGGMGVVYRARQRSLNRVVALKVIGVRGNLDEAQVRRFSVEAQATAALVHPSIVPVFEAGERGGIPFLSMAYVEGTNLNVRLKQDGPLHSRQAATLICKCAEAAEYAHQQGIIHRDLKPQNILIDVDGNPRITDFGLAKFQVEDGELTGLGDLLGTPSYMPPEQASGQAVDADCTADVYSLGATLYALLLGHPPFHAATVRETIRQVIEQDPPPPRRLNPAVPRDLETICLKCLQKSTRDRYPSAGALAQDLQRWLENRPIKARRATPLERAWKWCRRRPVFVGSTAATAFVVLIVGLLVSERLYSTHATGLVDGLATADSESVPALLEETKRYRWWTEPMVAERLAQAPAGSKEELHLAIARLSVDPDQAAILLSRLPHATPRQVILIRNALREDLPALADALRRDVNDEDLSSRHRLNAACMLAGLNPPEPRWLDFADTVAMDLTVTCASNLEEFEDLVDLMQPVATKLSNSVGQLTHDESLNELQREIAFSLLLGLAADQPEVLAKVLLECSPGHFGRIIDVIAGAPDTVRPILVSELGKSADDTLDQAGCENLARRQANAAIAMLYLDSDPPVWNWMQEQADSRARAWFVHRAAAYHVDPQSLLAQLGRYESDEHRTLVTMTILQCLGQFDANQLTIARRNQVTESIRRIYQEHADPGVHSASRWLLNHWGHGDVPLAANSRPALSTAPRTSCSWHVSGRGQTMVELAADVVSIGSTQSTEPERYPDEVFHRRQLSRRFAIASTEVTKAQWRAFSQVSAGVIPADHPDLQSLVPTDESSMIGITWFEAAHYCNWLSEQEGIPQEQWCYQPNDAGEYAAGMRAYDDYLYRTGYRLPTEGEWEFSCRGRSPTRWHFGQNVSLLPAYAWFEANAEGHTHPVGRLLPNEYGLFDMLGNASEWCHEQLILDPRAPWAREADSISPEITDAEPVNGTVARVFRGGSYGDQPRRVRAANRFSLIPSTRNAYVGFRVARTLAPLDEPD